MKIKNVNLKYMAFRYDWNNHKLVFTNVLAGMEEEIAKKVRKGKKDNWRPVYNYNTFKEWLKGEFMYYYWSKAEHETLIGDLFLKDEKELEKHDIWWQLEPNLDVICKYIINEMRITFKEDDKNEE